MIESILAKFFGTAHDRQMKQLQPLVDEIRSFETKLQALTDDQLKAKTPEFKSRLSKGETLDQILPEAFAVCREAGRRVMGMRHYDVQMIGGVVLHRGGIAEMRTGEGKTYVATLPVYLNALSGKGVQVVSVNDYLVTRDAEWMGRLYNWLGLSVGIIVHGLNDDERRAAYNADITYATNNELGFDYLRDNMKFDLSDYVQREHNFAIVDECDSILVDEARTPLIISGPAEASTDKYYAVDKIIPSLVRDTHFTMEEKSKTASLTEEGISKVESLLKLSNLFDPQHIEILHHVYQALKAHHLYRLDVEYMIKDGEVVIVDEFTGRLMPGRRWSDGLHQAIEAKEKVDVKNENQTLASITFQNYFRMYNKLSGMTGTAYTEAAEFKKIYKLDVVVIPTNKPIRREDHQDMVYKSENAKFRAITADLKEKHAKGQPILVGTASIEKSELLSSFLKKEGIRHDVLNAKHHEREAEIIAQAGRRGTITIATNMAGRGTDIVLGGNAEIMAKKVSDDENSPEYKEAYQKFKEQFDGEKKDVLAAGGLCIIGTERHESRRIDNQLRGRSGRQGDPGESKFYLSLEDNLLRIFNGDAVRKMMELLKVDENEPITAPMVSRAIEGAQKKVEGHNFDIRKHLLDYDDVMNQQRNVIYGMRREILKGNGVERTVLDMLGEVTSDILDQFVPESARNSDWNMEGLNNALNEQFGMKLTSEEMSTNSEVLIRNVSEKVKARYAHQKQVIGDFFEQFQKMILLQAIDQRWKEHLAVVDKLKEGISLRAYGQKDPLIEYKKEAFNQFESLNRVIRSETIEKLMKIQVAAQGMEAALQNMMPDEQDLGDLDYQAPSEADIGAFKNAPQQELTTSGPQKRRMTMGPRDPDDDRPMNRADRRRMNKRK